MHYHYCCYYCITKFIILPWHYIIAKADPSTADFNSIDFVTIVQKYFRGKGKIENNRPRKYWLRK